MNKKLILKNIETTELCLKELREKIKITGEEGKKIISACEEGIVVNEFVLAAFKKSLEDK